jgi:hypothetical protein
MLKYHVFKIRPMGASRYIRRDGQTHDEANRRFSRSQFCESAYKYLEMYLFHQEIYKWTEMHTSWKTNKDYNLYTY